MITLTDIQLIILVVGISEFLLFHFLTVRKRIHAFLSRHQPSVQPPPPAPAAPKQTRSVSGEDAGVVLRSLGMSDGARLPESLDLLVVFEEESPRLEEVKAAFDVFDEGRDGFIDAAELQKVLCSLGLSEGLRVDECRRMIALWDEDGDERMNFDEFVNFMERTFC